MRDEDASVLLDDPIRAALTLGNQRLAQGGPLAWRYPPQIAPFGALADRTPAAFEALAQLVPPDGQLVLTTADPLLPPASLAVTMQAAVMQMVMDAPLATAASEPSDLELGAADIPDMIDLAGRTRPGPFGPRTIELGRYIGIRVAGALAAMAGERMRFDRFVEVSAVCVDPLHRGRGLATLLVARLAARIHAQGLTPFLHVFADNAGAIALYRKLGFVRRGLLQLTAVTLRP